MKDFRRILADHLAPIVRDVILHVKLLDRRHGRFYHPGFGNQQASSWMMGGSETETRIPYILMTIELGSA